MSHDYINHGFVQCSPWLCTLISPEHNLRMAKLAACGWDRVLLRGCLKPWTGSKAAEIRSALHFVGRRDMWVWLLLYWTHQNGSCPCGVPLKPIKRGFRQFPPTPTQRHPHIKMPCRELWSWRTTEVLATTRMLFAFHVKLLLGNAEPGSHARVPVFGCCLCFSIWQ